MKIIKIIDTIVLLLAVGAFAFGAWGLYTSAGQREFRELAYIIPDLSMKAGLVLFAIHVVLLITTTVVRRRKTH